MKLVDTKDLKAEGFTSESVPIFESVTGDEPDESYYNNGPEQERYYFEQIK